MSIVSIKGFIVRNVLLILLFFIPWDAYAYIGPGIGVGTIGVVLGVFFSIILAFFAILWYPFKRLLKKLKKKKPDNSKEGADSA